MTTIRDEIFTIIAREAHVDPSKVIASTTLKDVDISSLEVLEILFAIEERFNVELPERDPGFETTSVGGLVTVLERLVGEKLKLQQT